jgi:O-antigen/teichoic acid export membrane protein
MTILFLGMGLVTIPEAARALQRSPRHLPLFCILVSGGLTVAALAWGVVLLVAVPRGLGNGLLGPIWRQTYPLVLPQMLYVMGQAVGSGAGTGLHALGAARRSLRVVLLMAAINSAFTLAGALTAGIAGTVIGMAIGAWVGSVLAWWQFRKAFHESDMVPAAAVPADTVPAADVLQPDGLIGKHRRVP